MTLQAIKKRLLELAIRGSLVPQIESEGTAEDILQAIAKEQKTKTSFSEIPESEQLFSIPNSWKWVRLGDICDVVRGGSPRPAGDEKYYNGNIPFLKVADLTRDENVYVEFAENSIKEAGLTKTRYVKSGTLLLTNSGATLGVPKITTFDTAFNDGIAAFLNLKEEVKLYCYYFLKSNTGNFRAINQGAGQPNLNTDIIKNTLLPLPPLDEQKRIVEKLDEVMKALDEIEQGRKNIEALKATLRNKALQLAIEGKLVEQRAEEGDARALLDEIKTEKAQLIAEKKIKKDKPLAPIDDSEIPFDIPDSWVWVRLGEVCDKMISTKPTSEYFKYIDIDAIDNKICKIREPKKTLTKNAPSRATRHTQKGDVLFSMVRPYLKNIALVEEDGCIASTGFYVCRPFDGLSSLFLFELMTSEYVVNGLNKFMKGDNSPSINNVDIENLPIPLPPLGEQKRIVEKLDEVMAEIDKL